MRLARWVFGIAGVYGLIVVTPHYFLEATIGRQHPPEITHPEFFYGFVGVALAWQVAFLIIAVDPVRYRLIMIPSVLEKFSFGLAVIALYQQGRVASDMLLPAGIDLLLGVLFLVAFWRTSAGNSARSQSGLSSDYADDADIL